MLNFKRLTLNIYEIMICFIIILSIFWILPFRWNLDTLNKKNKQNKLKKSCSTDMKMFVY